MPFILLSSIKELNIVETFAKSIGAVYVRYNMSFIRWFNTVLVAEQLKHTGFESLKLDDLS